MPYMRALAFKVPNRKIFKDLDLCKFSDPTTKDKFPYRGHYLKYFSGGPLDNVTCHNYMKSLAPKVWEKKIFKHLHLYLYVKSKSPQHTI